MEINQVLLDEFAMRLHVAHRAVRERRISATTSEIVEKSIKSIHDECKLTNGYIMSGEEIKGRSLERYYRRKAAGLCPNCGGPRTDQYVICAKCRDKARRRNK